LGGQSADCRIILKWVSTGFNWLATEMNDELLRKEADQIDG